MLKYHYWAVRPVSQGGENTRIEKAYTPESACHQCFGRGVSDAFEYKDLGTRAGVLQSDNKRVALLKDPAGWVKFQTPCYCGSGLPRRPLNDARGIFVTHVCDKCQQEQMARLPDVYPIDPDDYSGGR